MCGVGMKKILLLVTLLASLLCAQPFQIKQITNLNADCRNLNCGRYFGGAVYYTFEAHNESSSSVYLGKYFVNTDSFVVVMKVTDDNFINVNPKLLYSNDSLFIIYQTNKNGNWDIAYQVFLNNQLSPVYYVADSSSDETNPVVSTINEIWYSSQNQFVSYEKGNSIYIRDVHIPNSVETEVFHGDDSTKYSQVSEEINLGYQVFYMAARKVVYGKSSIVYKQYGTNGWGDEIVLVSTGTCRNPKIQENSWQPGLSYTDDINGKSNIILIENFSQPIDTLKLFDYPLYNYDNLWTLIPLIITKKKDFYSYIPYTYTASRNDSLFIRVNKFDMLYRQYDTLLTTKVINNHLYMGSFGSTGEYEVYYTVWEDSISGNIQLYGKRYLYPIGGFKDDYSPSDFTLCQNYPNPFNPTTTISYRLKEKGFVKLNVYYITGKLIKTLVNQIKDPGSYETEFNAKGLASGIYFYRLEVFGNDSSPLYSDIKKLVLLK
jgi:Secretion system C-terminal sorting domain